MAVSRKKHNLVIVESPAKVKTIKKFLGSNYEVAASNGHVRDLPKSKLGIDIEHDYEPQYITIRGKGELLAGLRKQVKKADRVLVDAPCSGLGVVRRKPEIKYRELSEDIMMMPKKQADILSASSSYVKPGGTLVYSTCTINPEENEKIIDQFLKRNRDFEKVERTLLLPNVNGTDGFFICVMKRDELIEQ